MHSRYPLISIVALALLAPAMALPSAPPPNAPPLPTLRDPGPPSVAGFWEAPFEGQIPAVHMALLPDGRVLYWSGDVAGSADWIYFFSTVEDSEARILAPPYTADSVSTPFDPDSQVANLFCSAHTILPDGTILSAGGSLWHATVTEGDTSFVDGVPDTRIFDWRTDTWTPAPDMLVPRWYPTVMTLGDGRGLVSSGVARINDPATHQPSIETFDGDWEYLPGGTNYLPLYPRLFEVPSGPLRGELYYETGGTLWGPFGEHPTEPLWNIAQSYDPETESWRFLGPSIFGVRQSPNNVMLPLDPADGYRAKILSFAGTLQRSIVGTNTAEIADLSTDPPTRSVAAALNWPRWQSNGVLLPDGKVLAIGGGLYDNVMLHGFPDPAIMVAELYDPAEDTWTEMAAMQLARQYHSTAVLLPDARVLVGGHVPNPVPWTAMRDNLPPADQAPQTKFEIFSPPYLHWGVEQATITMWPNNVGYGAAFTVHTPDAGRVVDAMIVRNGATTHSMDVGQRGVVLPVVARGDGTLTFTAPPDELVATPGPYMLFLRVASDDGLVPGIARTIMIG